LPHDIYIFYLFDSAYWYENLKKASNFEMRCVYCVLGIEHLLQYNNDGELEVIFLIYAVRVRRLFLKAVTVSLQSLVQIKNRQH